MHLHIWTEPIHYFPVVPYTQCHPMSIKMQFLKRQHQMEFIFSEKKNPIWKDHQLSVPPIFFPHVLSSPILIPPLPPPKLWLTYSYHNHIIGWLCNHLITVTRYVCHHLPIISKIEFDIGILMYILYIRIVECL